VTNCAWSPTSRIGYGASVLQTRVHQPTYPTAYRAGYREAICIREDVLNS
jgi:hypothetical protein